VDSGWRETDRWGTYADGMDESSRNTRTATPEELKALGHPTRWRILRLCLEPRTNQELADRLGLAPATTLRHVRALEATGFLEALPVRHGERGALERPYRATRLTWYLTLHDAAEPELSARVDVAVLDAHRVELLEAGPEATREYLRAPLRLSDTSQREFHARLMELLGDFLDREDPDGEPLSLLISLHRRAD
jgi:predicted ArsR family transcriptional regulator